MSTRLNQTLKIIYCWAPDEVIRQRLEHDLQTDSSNRAAQRTMEKYYRIKSSFQPITYEHLRVDTSQPVTAILQQVLDYLGISTY